ncbi:hypothetical protein XENOCAPTIV_000125 [Xenoophorus captivus]|uniref:Uncharacterized protein n=1 Tax=Xenoophorus captivus TaxID=1517983 RepID=A0ABV0QGG1_9TELE
MCVCVCVCYRIVITVIKMHTKLSYISILPYICSAALFEMRDRKVLREMKRDTIIAQQMFTQLFRQSSRYELSVLWQQSHQMCSLLLCMASTASLINSQASFWTETQTQVF